MCVKKSPKQHNVKYCHYNKYHHSIDQETLQNKTYLHHSIISLTHNLIATKTRGHKPQSSQFLVFLSPYSPVLLSHSELYLSRQKEGSTFISIISPLSIAVCSPDGIYGDLRSHNSTLNLTLTQIYS